MPISTQPTNSGRESNAAGYYQGQSLVDNNILQSARIYDRRTAFLTRIKQGRAAFTRLLLNYARSKGAYTATDTETRWGIEYERAPRIYCSAGSASTSGTKHDVLKFGTEGARLQPGQTAALIGFWVPPDRNVDPLTNHIPASSKNADSSTAATFAPVPENVKVLNVVKTSSGFDVYVERNFGGTGLAATGAAGMAVTVANFLWMMPTTLAEGRDDMTIYSDTDDWDFNYCEIMGAKWGATETEQNVNRFFTNEKPIVRNARRGLGEFFDQLDAKALLGTRGTTIEGGRRKWYAGGLLEFVPSKNWVAIGESTFQTKNMNTLLKDKFYYGNQVKLGLCGQNVYTGISNMLDNKIVLPASQNSWGVEVTSYKPTNGGHLLLVPSDTMSLNGFEDHMIMYDPDTFQYGHLQNMDFRQIKHVAVNPHEETGEIYGQITFKRTNPDANFVFVLS